MNKGDKSMKKKMNKEKFIKCRNYIFRKKDLTYISRDDNHIKIHLVINNEDYTLNECFNNSKVAIEEYDSIFEQLQVIEQEEVKEKIEIKSKEYKITLTEFWNSCKSMAIHCDSEEKADKLLKAFDKLGTKWRDGDSYLDDNHYKQDICYDNNCDYGYYDSYKKCNYTVYEFEDVDLNN